MVQKINTTIIQNESSFPSEFSSSSLYAIPYSTNETMSATVVLITKIHFIPFVITRRVEVPQVGINVTIKKTT